MVFEKGDRFDAYLEFEKGIEIIFSETKECVKEFSRKVPAPGFEDMYMHCASCIYELYANSIGSLETLEGEDLLNKLTENLDSIKSYMW